MSAVYVPLFQGLSAMDFVRPAAGASCFPFNAPARIAFYRARNAIYHLFDALRARALNLKVLVPDYNSGSEVLALSAAGASLTYYPVGRDMTANPAEIERLCEHHDPDALYVIHYLGWPQPIDELAALCRRRGMLLIEDCALSLLSEPAGRPLGTIGHWSVFCLYKTLPVPNGSLLVQNGEHLDSLDRLRFRRAGAASVMGRIGELIVQRLRGRATRVGAAMQAVKRGLGRAVGALDVSRAPVGDIGFNLADVDLGMSGASGRLLTRLHFDDIRRRRIDNYRTLSDRLAGSVTPARGEPVDGACPLFFPILVSDKPAAARALRQRGVSALEFWNYGAAGSEPHESGPSRYLRSHVLALPIHQDLTAHQIAHIARQVAALDGLKGQHPCD